MGKQTAVEWLMEMISYTSKDMYSAMESSNFFDKAKAMEREQIEDAYSDGLNAHRVVFCNRKEYYGHRYGKEASDE